MKKILLGLLAAVCLVLTSCELSSYQNDTPGLYFSQFYVTRQVGDSVVVDSLAAPKYNMQDDIYYLDTVLVGDTVHFAVRAYSFTNNLVSLVFERDSNMLQWATGDLSNIKSALSGQTNVNDLKFYFNTGYNLVTMLFTYIPKKEGKSDFTVTATSDSTYPTASVKINQPVR